MSEITRLSAPEFAGLFRARLRARQLEHRERRAFAAGSAITWAVMTVMFVIALVAA